MADIGRPTNYNEEIVTRTQEYLESCQDEVRQVVIGESDKFTSYKEKVTVNLPSIEGLSRFLKISKDTIYAWEKIHPDFSYVLHELRSEQALRLINMGLSGDYNPVISKLLLSKHGYVDKIESELTGKGGEALIGTTQLTDIQFTQLLNAVNEKSNPG